MKTKEIEIDFSFDAHDFSKWKSYEQVVIEFIQKNGFITLNGKFSFLSYPPGFNEYAARQTCDELVKNGILSAKKKLFSNTTTYTLITTPLKLERKHKLKKIFYE